MAPKKRTYRSAAERVQITEDGPLNGKTTPDIAGRFIQKSPLAQLLKHSKAGKSRKSYLKTGVSYLKSCEKKKCCSRHNFIVIPLHNSRTSTRWWWKKSRCHSFVSGISRSIALVIVSTFMGKSCLCSYHKPKLLPFFINMFSDRLRRFLYDHC